MIKQIQLRGISRAPSDRLSEDGGLSESLNMHVDTAENAPALVPEDVTNKLGLPDGLQAERIFIHKTPNYENIIAVLRDKIVAFTSKKDDEEPLVVMELIEGDKINDITSLGNTLIVSTDSSLYYLLYRDSVYVNLGNKVPFLDINFDKERLTSVQLDYFKEYYYDYAGSSSEEGFFGSIWFRKGGQVAETSSMLLTKNINIGALPSEELWNEENFNSEDTIRDDTDSYWLKSFKNSIVSLLNPLLSGIKKDNHFSGLMFVRYEIETYSGKISSMPILIKSDSLQVNVSQFSNVSKTDAGDGVHLVRAMKNSAQASLDVFDITAKLNLEEGIEQWKDIISNINIYISVPSSFYLSDFMKIRDRKYTTYTSDTNSNNQITESSGVVFFNGFSDEEQTLLEQSSLTYLVKSIPFFDKRGVLSDEIKELAKGQKLTIKEELYDSSILMQQPWLEGDDMKHYALSASGLSVFNNHLMLVQPCQQISYDYNRLNAYDKEPRNEEEPRTYDAWYKYEVTFLLKGAVEDKVVKAGPFLYSKLVGAAGEEEIYSFQIFPDSRAYKMIVKVESYQDSLDDLLDTTYGEFDMLPHPYLDCAYFYGGLSTPLRTLCNEYSSKEYNINAKDDIENKLFISKIDDPFTFPLEHRYTFQSKVLGVAVASTALSQGQFGQYPLYAFTEDGIWAMETAADGSFVTSKPLSREVCVNSDSITPIDNAVVFVTDKAVMLIQGSEVVNISQYMNGRHYIPSESSLDIIADQEGFAKLIDTIKDEDPFMSFVKSAKIAYDYAGQRLIFISSESGNPFQYIYKIDTQTWHKTAFDGLALEAPLNSYPECLVKGEENGHARVYDLSTILDASRKQDTAKGILITRPFDLGMPDVYKSITRIKIRGDYDKENVKFILQGSNNGKDFVTLNSFRGKSWKMFRIFILADLEPTERISWIDVDFEPRYNNRLR